MKHRALPAAALIALPLQYGAASATPLDAAFEILRNDRPIGMHWVDVEETGDGLSVNTRIEMKVKFGPITMFRYEHRSEEFWRDGVLQTLDSWTDSNGRLLQLKAERTGDTLIVQGEDYDGPVPASAAPSSYWNKAIVDAEYLLNTQTGALIPISKEPLGMTETPAGFDAEKFRLTGTVALDLWYDGPRWVGADFIVRGERLKYRLVEDDRAAQIPIQSAAGN